MNFKLKVIKKTNITKNGNSTVPRALTEEFSKMKANLVVKLVTKPRVLIKIPFSSSHPNFIQF